MQTTQLGRIHQEHNAYNNDRNLLAAWHLGAMHLAHVHAGSCIPFLGLDQASYCGNAGFHVPLACRFNLF